MAVRDLMDYLGGTEARVAVVYEHTAFPSLLMGMLVCLQALSPLSIFYCLETVQLMAHPLYAFRLETTPKSGAEHKKWRVWVAEHVKNNFGKVGPRM